MKHSEISNYYSDFLDSFLYVDEIDDLDLSKNEISKAIYKHIFKIKTAQWKYKVMFNRRKSIAISDLFQDIVALYISLALGNDYEVIVEEKIGRLHPDILIKYKGQNLFIVEIKTTIGWERDMYNNGEMQKRMNSLSSGANIPVDNIVYVFLSPWNVNKKFANVYWDSNIDKPKELPNDYPFNRIRPLLSGEDPFYWKQHIDFRNKRFQEFSDSDIDKFAESGIVIPLELTIEEIKIAAKTFANTRS